MKSLKTPNMKFKTYINTHSWIKTLFSFILAAVITVFVEKACNRVSPDEPIIIKEVKDTIILVHKYDFDSYNDSVINAQLKYKLENIELSQKYEEKIAQKITKENGFNPIITDNIFTKSKGYSPKDGSPYFKLDMSSTNNDYYDFELFFIDKSMINKIFCLSLKIVKIDNNQRVYYLDENYKVNEGRNRIRIANTLPQGSYNISVGFVFDKDKDKDYPIIYCITKRITR